VTVLGGADIDDRRSVLLMVLRQDGTERRVVAEQLWAEDEAGLNATILENYRSWAAVGLDY
jgi:hypothetical protein